MIKRTLIVYALVGMHRLLSRGWCQRDMAQNAEGEPIAEHHPSARSWCIVGAKSRCAANLWTREVRGRSAPAVMWLLNLCVQFHHNMPALPGMAETRLAELRTLPVAPRLYRVAEWQDRIERTQAEVLDLLAYAGWLLTFWQVDYEPTD